MISRERLISEGARHRVRLFAVHSVGADGDPGITYRLDCAQGLPEQCTAFDVGSRTSADHAFERAVAWLSAPRA